MTAVQPKEIAALLVEHRRLKAEVKEVRGKLVAAVVEVCGLPQDVALKTDVDAFLDGYLVGQGMTRNFDG